MTLFNAFRPDYFDHLRLAEDLRDTFREVESVQKAKITNPPIAFLQRLGKDLLHADLQDAGALRLQRDHEITDPLREAVFGYAFGGRVMISWLLAAVILARDDLHARFRVGGRLSLELGLQWLVLHGINEHRLWHLVSARLVKELTYATLPPYNLCPLSYMTLCRTEAPAPTRNSNDTLAPAEILKRYESADHFLFWCMTSADEKTLFRRRLASSIFSNVSQEDGQPPRAKTLLSMLRRFTRATFAVASSRLRTNRVKSEYAAAFQRAPLSRRWGHPLTYWEGGSASHTVVAGVHGPRTLDGLPMSEGYIGLAIPIEQFQPHSAIVEFSSRAPAPKEAVFWVNGHWVPAIQMSRYPGCLWLVDLSRVSARASLHVSIAEVTPESQIDRPLPGYLLDIAIPTHQQFKKQAMPPALSRIWTF